MLEWFMDFHKLSNYLYSCFQHFKCKSTFKPFYWWSRINRSGGVIDWTVFMFGRSMRIMSFCIFVHAVSNALPSLKQQMSESMFIRLLFDSAINDLHTIMSFTLLPKFGRLQLHSLYLSMSCLQIINSVFVLRWWMVFAWEYLPNYLS